MAGPDHSGSSAIPGGFTAKDVSLSQINLQWNASAGATQYLIYQLNATTQQSVEFTTSNLSYQVTNLTANTQYYFYIKASNQTAGPGLWSNPVTATTALPTDLDPCSKVFVDAGRFATWAMSPAPPVIKSGTRMAAAVGMNT